MKRVALYLRVSTADQSVDLQRRELLEFCERRGWAIAGEFSDIAVSGAKDSRPELDKLMDLAKKRKVDVICVWRFDRFARSVSHLLRALELFQSLGIDFVSYSEAIDTSTPVGRMTFVVLGAVAELERSLIRERVIAGQKAARAKGIRFGRPCTAVQPSQVAELRAAGRSFASIAEALGIAAGTAFKLFSDSQSSTPV
jgi:DNA invertase Pin-like site-specific DNA recombinase